MNSLYQIHYKNYNFMIIQNKLSIENNQKQLFNKTIYEIILISKYQGQKMKNKKNVMEACEVESLH